MKKKKEIDSESIEINAESAQNASTKSPRVQFEISTTSNSLDCITIPLERAHIQVDESTPLPDIHQLFVLMRLQSLYITEQGKLVGIITRAHLRDIVNP